MHSTAAANTMLSSNCSAPMLTGCLPSLQTLIHPYLHDMYGHKQQMGQLYPVHCLYGGINKALRALLISGNRACYLS